MQARWQGVFPAVTTQMKKDQSLDLEATARHLEALIDSGVDGLVMLGSLGENAALEPDEKKRVLAAAKETAAGRVPVLSGVVETSTAASIRYARDAEKMGLDGLMVLPAMIYRADAAETLAHFRAVARGYGLPIICYNNPLAYVRRHHAANVRRAGRDQEPRRDQGIFRRRPAHHRSQEHGRRPLPRSSAASTTWCWRASCWARPAGSPGMGHRVPGGEPATSGISRSPGDWDEARRDVSLVHAAPAPRHAGRSSSSTSSSRSRKPASAPNGCARPACRSRVRSGGAFSKIIHHGIETRPQVPLRRRAS